jgi:hypothetical protein
MTYYLDNMAMILRQKAPAVSTIAQPLPFSLCAPGGYSVPGGFKATGRICDKLLRADMRIDVDPFAVMD